MKDVLGFEPFYKITEDGRLFSVRSNKFLSPKEDKDGYLEYCLCVNDIRTYKRAHRLVAEVFLPSADPINNQVNHIDGDKKNNHYSNLEWVTSKENNCHAIRTGLRIGVRGETNNLSKHTDKFILDVVNFFLDCRDIGKTCEKFNFKMDVLDSMLGRNKANHRLKYLNNDLWERATCFRKILCSRFNPYLCVDSSRLFFTHHQINNFTGLKYSSSVFSRFKNGEGISGGKMWSRVSKNYLLDRVSNGDRELIDAILKVNLGDRNAT